MFKVLNQCWHTTYATDRAGERAPRTPDQGGLTYAQGLMLVVEKCYSFSKKYLQNIK